MHARRMTRRNTPANHPRERDDPAPGILRVTAHSTPSPVSAGRGSPLRGRLRVPGDKSISHRALILGLLAIGETRDRGAARGRGRHADGRGVPRPRRGRRPHGPGSWRVTGAGIGGLTEPAGLLDFGNAGTGARLMMGVAGSHPITATFDGDASLRKRPMRRILDPLERMGTIVVSQAEGGRVPLTLRGPRETIPITYETPAASAQIKSAVLLAGLNSPGVTTVVEREATRDHTERMLRHFGAEVSVEPDGRARPQDRPARPADPHGRADRGAVGSVLGGVPARRRADRAGLGRRPRRRHDEPACAPG